MIAPFTIARLPKILFGEGTLAALPGEIAAFGQRVLIVTGGRSFRNGPHWEPLTKALAERGVTWEVVTVKGEPSPDAVDAAVKAHRSGGFQVVAGIGGGSALDFAKAVAGLLVPGTSVMDHLEGVGPELPYKGPALPFIAVPTTAGTGSEATKNAVLSRSGPDGFKKSFRHDDLVARTAIVDPALLATCPRAQLVANGMDAFTQLLESYVSTRSNPMTEALAWTGMEMFAKGFLPAVEKADPAGFQRLAFASLQSGICLAQTGLGSVHGLAPPLGAFFGIPHGVACGTLVAEATAVNIKALRERAPDSPALRNYARVGRLIGRLGTTTSGDVARDALVKTLRTWQTRLELPPLAGYRVTAADIPRIVANSRGSSMKTNPVDLTDEEIAEVVRRRL